MRWAIQFRFAHAWLLYLLPVAGIVIYFLYKLWGKGSEGGNNLIMDEIHQPGGGVPFRMDKFRLSPEDVSMLLKTGIAAGFGAVLLATVAGIVVTAGA